MAKNGGVFKAPSEPWDSSSLLNRGVYIAILHHIVVKTERKILASTLSREVVRNWLISEDPFSFGTKQPSATLQVAGMLPFAQANKFMLTVATFSINFT